MLQMGEYRFSRHGRYRAGGPRIIWICGKWSSGCRASITTFNSEVIKMNTTHTHNKNHD